MVKVQLKELNEQVITLGLLEEIEEMEEVLEIECNGVSGQHLNKKWYSVKLENEEIQVYC